MDSIHNDLYINHDFYALIDNLSAEVRVSEDKKHVVFLSDRFCDSGDYNEDYPFIPSDGAPWINHRIFDGVTKLVVENVSGFNADPRSHVNKLVANQEGVARMPLVSRPVDHVFNDSNISQYITQEWIESNDDGHDGQGSLQVAQKCRREDVALYNPKYTLEKHSEITLGDLLYAFMVCKSAKTDLTYEHLTDCIVELEDGTLTLLFALDHKDDFDDDDEDEDFDDDNENND